ncbi:hypothetical protein [Rhizobium wenxiniae]|uniref:hypothetical protein n=1 Tax=Rhizobium wenxiniae TaxID=1737357 RepID=UPI003C18CC6E
MRSISLIKVTNAIPGQKSVAGSDIEQDGKLTAERLVATAIESFNATEAWIGPRSFVRQAPNLKASFGNKLINLGLSLAWRII